MRSRTCCLSLLVVLLATGIAPVSIQAQPSPVALYRDDTAHLGMSPAANGGVAAALANPAAWSATERQGSAFWWSDLDRGRRGLQDWGFSSNRFLGVSARHRSLRIAGATAAITDWQMGFSVGDRHRMTGIAWRWSSGDTDMAGRQKALVLGQILRPNRYLSLGLSGAASMESNHIEGALDLALRPTGSDRLTLFADYSQRKREDFGDGRFSAGFELRPLNGFHLGLKFQDTEAANEIRTVFSLGFTFSASALHARTSHDEGGTLSHTTYMLEMSPDADPFSSGPLARKADRKRIKPIDLRNKVLTYQKFRHFDNTHLPWMDLLPILEAIERDEGLSGVALNISGFRGRPSLIWELRQQLQRLRDAGKTVHIHMDRGNMLSYDLASVADHLSLDPEGQLLMPGFQVSRTYMAGLLEKLGLGFTALQYFPHKTAVENLSRRDMSDGDREQLGRLVDVLYDTVRDDVCTGRDITPAEFDRIIDDEVMINATRAKDLDLVDSIERWHSLQERLTKEEKVLMADIDRNLLRVPLDRHWGRRRVIAVVNAVGVCDMETGIRGRATSEYLRALAGNPSVAAVVLRADSPGGDPLPSDLVAEAITLLKEAGKPVIISQGDVAASGGYWISMNGSHVMTTPLTITGSVGVISGWLWDKEMHEKVGLSTDGPHRGKHATLFRNMRYPVGFNIPAREMTEEEYDQARGRILDIYERFLSAVAEGRGLEKDIVRGIAGGRIWMGEDAVANGLCDGIGGLRDAIAKARDLAGIREDEDIRLIEYPPRPFMEMPQFGPSLPSLGIFAFNRRNAVVSEIAESAPVESSEFEFMRAIAESRGSARVILPPYLMPEAWRTIDR